MRHRLTTEQLKEAIEKLIDCEAFEFLILEREQSLVIPYMMNDAIENYLILTNVRLLGTWDEEKLKETTADFGSHEGKNGIFLRQGMDNLVSIWYEEAYQAISCYQYHTIGHFWRAGEEEYRRLVYIVGTIRDKIVYCGEEYGNEQEMELIPLMEFAPFYYWSPVDEPLDEWYEASEKGTQCMIRLADEVKDGSLVRLLKIFLFLQKNGFRSRFIDTWMAKELRKKKHRKLYEAIDHKICQASLCYPKRMHGEKMTGLMEKQRKLAAWELLNEGYRQMEEEVLPCFCKGTEQVILLEEIPFTVSELEFDGYSYRLYAMRFGNYEAKDGFFETTVRTLYREET